MRLIAGGGYNWDANTWTGADTPSNRAKAESNCQDWTSTSGMGAIGFSSSTDSFYFYYPGTLEPCSTSWPVYCLQR